MSLKRYLRPKRLWRTFLFFFGLWGLWIVITTRYPQVAVFFRRLSQGEAAQLTGELINYGAGQFQKVLGQKTSQPAASSETNQQLNQIFETLKQDIKAFPQQEVKKIQRQVCEQWLSEE